MTKISATIAKQGRFTCQCHIKELRTSYVEQTNTLKTSLAQLKNLLIKLEGFDYINLPDSNGYAHFIRQRYIYDETMNVLKDGAILAPQLLQDDAALKSIFKQASDDEIIDFKASITDGDELDEELAHLIKDLGITYPEQSEDGKTPEKLFYESCINKILGNV